MKFEEKLAKAKAKSQVSEDMQDSLLLKSGETAKEVGISHEATKVRTSVDVHQFSGKIQNPPTRMKMDDTRTSHQEPLLRSLLKKPRESPSSSSEITGDISRMLCNLLRQQSAPDVDIPVFKGNPLEYHYFMSSFKEALECKIDDPHGRLVHLLEFTDGEAKETYNIVYSNHQRLAIDWQKHCWKSTMETHIKYWLHITNKSKVWHH